MTDAQGRGVEAEPLKGGEPEEGVSKEESCAGKVGLSHLTGWRTAALLFSLFVCLVVVFAFSFILPCPVRAQYEPKWNHSVSFAATYDFMAVEDVNKDKFLDVIFIYKDADANRNTCLSEDLSVPCLVLTALAGTNGKKLWERPLAAEFDWVECGVKGLGGDGTGCLVAHADNLTAVNKQSGQIMWQQPRSTVTNGNLPLIRLPDLDSDEKEDFAILSYNPEATPITPTVVELVFFSGKSGDQMGSSVVINVTRVKGHLQFTTASGALYLLLLTDSGLYAVSLKHLAAKAKDNMKSPLTTEKSWEDRPINDIGFYLYQSDSLKRVLAVPGSSPQSLLIQTDSSVSLFNTDKQKVTWTTNTSAPLSVPTFGRFDKDEFQDIMIEEDVGNNTKRVRVLSGQSGAVLWEVDGWSSTPSPRPASVLTLNTYSIFMLWGHNKTNQIHSSFLLHPRYSDVLLERRNRTQNIVSFNATLLERGRNACYFVLSGSDGRQAHTELDETNEVILTKQKIKADASESNAYNVKADLKNTEDSVKEAFNRLRFSDKPF